MERWRDRDSPAQLKTTGGVWKDTNGLWEDFLQHTKIGEKWGQNKILDSQDWKLWFEE